MDNQTVTILVLLDLSAAFDTVDHKVLLRRLSQDVGVAHHAIKWFTPYMSDRTQSVHIHDASSPVGPLAYGVPHGSVLRSQLFSVYTAPVAKIISKYSLMFHLYEDDTQLYLSVKPLQMDVAAAVECIEGGVAEIRAWMSSNFLKLNDDKTEVIIFGSAQQLTKIELHVVHIGDSLITVSHNVGILVYSSTRPGQWSCVLRRFTNLLSTIYAVLQGLGAT